MSHWESPPPVFQLFCLTEHTEHHWLGVKTEKEKLMQVKMVSFHAQRGV